MRGADPRARVRLTRRLLVPILTLTTPACASGAQALRFEEYQRDLAGSAYASAPQLAGDVDPFVGLAVLDRQRLVRAVVERNPSVEAARQGWRAALSRYPQATALDDPSLGYTLAPGSIGSERVRFGQVVQLGQRLPWPGKLALRGEVALAEAEAKRGDLRATRLRLGLIASLLFDDLYALVRALEINDEHAALLGAIKRGAEARYAAGRGSQQAPLQAEVELAHIEHQRVVLDARRRVVVAQLNGLLHRRPDALVPPPPDVLPPPPSSTASAVELQEQALTARPEVEAICARIKGAAASRDLARREYYPDVTVGGSYNSMWARVEHQLMLGFSVNLPLQLGRRAAAVDEAEASRLRLESELAGLGDAVRVEVESARVRLVEALHVVRLYETRLIPVARDQMRAAKADFESGRASFLALIEAERNLRSVSLEGHRAVADAWRRAAELSRALGELPGRTDGGDER